MDTPLPLNYDSPRQVAPDRPAWLRRVMVVLLLLVGVQIWLVAGRGVWGTVLQVKLTCLLGAIVMVPPVNRWIAARLDGLRNPSPRARFATGVVVAIASTFFLTWAAFELGRYTFPKIHDENMHMVQMQLLARGKLWTTPHPMADFFETFFVFHEPVYAPIHFYGTSLLFVPTVWLDLPKWVMPVIAAGVIVGLTYRVVAEAVDGVAGLLAALMLASTSVFRMLSFSLMSHLAIMLFGLAIIWAWMRWRERMTWSRALVIGLFAGWAAVTRPVDALAYAVPVGLAMMWDLRRSAAPIWARTAAAVVVGAAPFLAVQLVFNKGVTGEWLTTPYGRYVALFHPNSGFGFGDTNVRARPATQLPQKITYYESFIVPAIRSHQPGNRLSRWGESRFPVIVASALPHPFFAVVVPVGVLAVFGARRLVVAATFVLFLLLYALHPFMLGHYPPIVAPALIMVAVLAPHAIGSTWPRLRAWAHATTAVLVLVLCLTSWPQTNRFAVDDWIPMQTMIENARLPERVEEPAIVMFRYHVENSPHEEPVYTTEAISPDDVPIIRAHELGERNVELYRYYAARQPNRKVYLFDRADNSLHYLGPVTELAK